MWVYFYRAGGIERKFSAILDISFIGSAHQIMNLPEAPIISLEEGWDIIETRGIKRLQVNGERACSFKLNL